MNAIIIGAYWGDEGKGKIVDLLASDFDWIVRYNGGDNAGHTIVTDSKKVVLHILPSGVLQGKNVLIGPDVFFNPASFLKDMQHVFETGFKIEGQIVIDERAHLIMPYHMVLDTKIAGTKIGTTRRGIGPAAKDRAHRVTDITVSDMLSADFLSKIRDVVNIKADELISNNIIGSKQAINRYCERVYEVYSSYVPRIKKFVKSGNYLLDKEIKKGKKILLEGAQGSLLDVVHGTRPYITSSNTIAGGASANLGLSLKKFKVIGIAKAYPTRVGEGPFPTELGSYEDTKKEEKGKELSLSEKREVIKGNETLLGRWIRLDGDEYGATTGRARRTGFPDFVALKYSAMINGVDEWAVTKIDVLGGKTFKAAVAYKKGNTITEQFHFMLHNWKPIYEKEYFWPKMSDSECKSAIEKGFDALPKSMKDFIHDLVIYTGVPVSMISLSPRREITVVKDVLKTTKSYLK